MSSNRCLASACSWADAAETDNTSNPRTTREANRIRPGWEQTMTILRVVLWQAVLRETAPSSFPRRTLPKVRPLVPIFERIHEPPGEHFVLVELHGDGGGG